MKKYILLVLSLFTVAVVSVVISSCGGDDPQPNAKVSFSRSDRSVSEAVGTFEVEVILDRPADENIIVEYDLDGTAVEGALATADYEITSDLGEVEIQKGESSGTFTISIKNDALYEGTETIELSISDVNGKVDISENDVMTITITDNEAQPIVSFKEANFTVNEDDGAADIEVVLDAAAAEDVIVSYSIDGTAIDTVYGTDEAIPSYYWDYFINGVSGEVTIPAGETSALIEVRIYTDFVFENPESIEFMITAAEGAQVTTVPAKQKITGVLEQQDGRIIELSWGTTQADMNLFLWTAENVADLGDLDKSFILGYAVYAQKPADPVTYAFEDVFLPTIMADLLPEADAFGVSCLYRTGDVSPLNFELLYADFADGDVEDEANWIKYDATYTTINKNNFPTNTDLWPIVVQTFERNGAAYTNISDLTVPAEGSRIRTPHGGPSKHNIVMAKSNRININRGTTSLSKYTRSGSRSIGGVRSLRN